MTALDIVALVLLGGGAVFGAMRGFVHEALSLIAWVLAVMAVTFFHTPVMNALAAPIGSVSGAAVAAVVLLFGGTFVVGRLLASALGKRTRQSVLGPVDRVLGFGFGFVKGLILAALLFLLATLVIDTVRGGPAHRPDWMRKARTYSLMSATSRAMVDYMNQRRGALRASDNSAAAR
ncbi:colicin V production protein CvpA [Sphingomonas changbaiensis NBRC 104936]|uniref:Colicin V production protein CvpA n=1 Tax=Sphingomonas changbaiensis NBRC 104936 TaxID=1219043 RepID=A0A0E9MLS8_9SPHN|nr:CvpA family protein [Sphingomonas changbaiensis]GAO38757.1 colicin V production protein CvpA [Sphingomonas changbaiensis NBRC 104936]